MIRNFCLFVVALIVTFFAANTVFAKTFFDNFDDQTFTSNNWQEAAPTWSFIIIDNSTTPVDYGFRVSTPLRLALMPMPLLLLTAALFLTT